MRMPRHPTLIRRLRDARVRQLAARCPPRAASLGRLAINAMILTGSAYAWLGIGKGLNPARGEVFQLAGPARACSVILAMAATGFVAAMAVSPAFGAPIWRAARTPWDWTLGLAALILLTGYFAWARFALGRRFYGLMSGLVALLAGLYVGIRLVT